MQTLPHNVYLAQQVRELDRITIEEFDISGIELMQRAAQSVFSCIKEHYSKAKHIAVFCGSGNNAGDGYFVAAFALQAGFKVDVYAIGDKDKLTSDALKAYQYYEQQQGKCVGLDYFSKADLIVDALLGTGLTREVSGLYAKAVEIINQSTTPVIAVDIPSGIHADTGQVMGKAVKADITVSFIGLKQGMFTSDALNYCGEIIFNDLNVPKQVFQKVSSKNKLLTSFDAFKPRLRNSHKGLYGHVLLVGGDKGFSGAVRLAAEAALRSGAGLVSIATHPAHTAMLNLGQFELMCHGVENKTQLQALIEKATVIVLGTGLGQSNWSKMLFDALIDSPLPMVIDADGLNLLANKARKHQNRVLTPHPKEAARLLNWQTQDINKNRFEAVKVLQEKYAGVCLLKGAGTLIKNDTELFVNTSGNAGMATAGMGDVLAGLIGGLIAQGLSLTQATSTGVYLHGKAAELASFEDGERGLLASDLMPYIRKLVNWK